MNPYEEASITAAELVGPNSCEYERVTELEYERLHVQRLKRVMAHFGCTSEHAEHYCALRDEGYNATQAALMAGIGDPP